MRQRPKERHERRNKNVVLIFFILLLVFFLGALFTSASLESGRRLIPLGVLALIGGVLFEGRRISEKWSTVFGATLWSLLFSLLAFLPAKGETDYDFASHVEMWPYWFIIIFALIFVTTNGSKVTPRLTEGITLLQSIAVIYWVIDYGILNTGSYFLQALMTIGLTFALYSFVHAFTYIPLKSAGRFTLSLWSSIVMVLFAVDNIYRVYQNDSIENAADISDAIYIALQFFLLGISTIYVIQNFIMLIGFMPGRDTFFNAQYFRDVRRLKKDHVGRYSEQQVNVGLSILCAIFACGVFASNYYYEILPRHVAIWTVFVVFPFFLGMIGVADPEYIVKRTK